MTLFTVKDIKKINPTCGKKELREFGEAILHGYREYRRYDIFLTHTGIPLPLLYILTCLIEEMGFSVFVDPFNLKEVPLKAGIKDHIKQLKEKMPHCDCLLIAAAAHATESTLISWLLGYYESLKKKVAVIPIFEKDINTIDFNGNGFLSMYPYIGVAKSVQDGKKTLWIMKNRKEYINIEHWMAVDHMRWEKESLKNAKQPKHKR
jgi:hypothetical protein